MDVTSEVGGEKKKTNKKKSKVGQADMRDIDHEWADGVGASSAAAASDPAEPPYWRA
jgi:hypothetical protein